MILSREFFTDSPRIVARNLLGKILVRQVNGQIVSGKIVETEAYFGEDDPASRAYRRKFLKFYLQLAGLPGRTFIYMVHTNWLLNIVAHKENDIGAVLLRALEPLEGINTMKQNRPTKSLIELTNGPGKLTKAFGITQVKNLTDVTKASSEILIHDSDEKVLIGKSKRIGVTHDLDEKLRFYIIHNSYVSK